RAIAGYVAESELERAQTILLLHHVHAGEQTRDTFRLSAVDADCRTGRVESQLAERRFRHAKVRVSQRRGGPRAVRGDPAGRAAGGLRYRVKFPGARASLSWRSPQDASALPRR